MFDSIGRAPLSGADVHLLRIDSSDSAASRMATTDARGMYQIPEVEPGTYLVGFFHPAADSLGLTPAGRRILVREGGNRVDLALPSATTIVARLCDGGRLTDSTALLVGFVRHAERLDPLPDASVTISWTELAVNRQGVFQVNPRVTIPAPNGWFALCDAPAGVRLLLRAAAGTDTSGVVESEFTAGRIVRHDFYVGEGETVTDADTVSVDLAFAGIVRRGQATLTGQVLAMNGQPIHGATVAVRGATSRASTGEDGSFKLTGLPAGTHMVEARAIGYVARSESVHILSAAANRIDLSLTRTRDYLDTVRVTASRVLSRDRTGFDRRRRTGLGHFLDRDGVERRQAMNVIELLRGIPGVTVRWGTYGFEPFMNSPFLGEGASAAQGAPYGYCRPAFFVDGLRLNFEAADISALVLPENVEGIEVYTRPSFTPGEFSTPYGCGSIVIWTGPPRPKLPDLRKGS